MALKAASQDCGRLHLSRALRDQPCASPRVTLLQSLQRLWLRVHLCLAWHSFLVIGLRSGNRRVLVILVVWA